ncbi:MAG: TraR/DksA family transcriptional regulator [Deltaproteobacteria bacterium]|nr:TraR/DksA family transcriptional regulator [Deltaproteobacteria bacterium]
MRKEINDDIEEDRIKSNSAITNEIGDEVDHASEERDRELYQLLGDRERKKLEQIEHALERIEDETYGICEECDSKISKKRLMALPFTMLCVDCKSEEERTKGKDGYVDLQEPNFSSFKEDI